MDGEDEPVQVMMCHSVLYSESWLCNCQTGEIGTIREQEYYTLKLKRVEVLSVLIILFEDTLEGRTNCTCQGVQDVHKLLNDS